MFNVPQSKINQFAKLFDTHRVQISACDVYFQNIRMLNGRHHIMDRKTFEEYYKTFTSDIELQTSPIDAFIPNDITPTDTPDEMDVDELMNQRLFFVNRDVETVPEYGRIKNRITEAEIRKTLNETHPVIMALTNNEVTMDEIVDDVFIYWAVYKYIEQITMIRLQIFSNMTPLIEYISENISRDDLKRALHSKINPKKIAKYHDDMLFFGPDYRKICEYYDPDKSPDSPVHFDLSNLIDRILSNVDIKCDEYIALGMYLIASYAVSDFMTPDKPELTESERYVLEVLSTV